MDPFFSLGLAAAQFGASAFGQFAERDAQREQVRSQNQLTRIKNQSAMQNWQYNEQMRQRENRNARALYEMKKQQYNLQKELNYDEYKEFYEDQQLAFDQLVRDTVNKSFQSSTKLAKMQGAMQTTRADRGVGGRRANRASQNAMMWQGMEQTNRNERLVFQENQMQKAITRGAKRTDLRNQLAFNAVGPAPEDLPMAPQPLMLPMQQQGSDMGLYTGLLSSAVGAVGTYQGLAGQSPLSGGSGTPSAADMGYTTNPATGNLRNGWGLSIR